MIAEMVNLARAQKAYEKVTGNIARNVANSIADKVVAESTKRYIGYAGYSTLSVGLMLLLVSSLLVAVSQRTSPSSHGLSVAGLVFGSLGIIAGVLLVAGSGLVLAKKDEFVDKTFRD